MNIEKEIKKILLDEDIEIKELARRLNTSQQNISAKLKRNNFTVLWDPTAPVKQLCLE